MRLKYTIIAALALTAGCTTAAEQIDQQLAGQQPPSTELRQKVVQAAREVLVDPYSVRDAEISAYVPAPKKPGSGFVCLKYNSKNAMGGYSGRTLIGTNVINGELRGVFTAPYQCQLPQLRWYPFPEVKLLHNL